MKGIIGIAQLIRDYYDIGNITTVKNTAFGSGNNTFIVETDNNKYVAKLNSKFYEIEIYNRVENQLRSSIINQPSIILTNSGQLMAPRGLVIYQYVQGNTLTHFDKDMEKKALRYIYQYNQELKKVSIEDRDLLVENDWDRIRSLDYIFYEAPERIMDLDFNYQWKELLLGGIADLSNHRHHLKTLNKQLIHSDLGASNLLVLDDEICAVIDFSPSINHELYSLAQFVYWNYLWRAKKLNKEDIDQYFNDYYRLSDSEEDKRAFCLLLVNACVFRVLGPLFEMSPSNDQDYGKLEKRFELLRWAKENLLYVE
jgi:Ser/Thr protein kinase RdoA (MazF antagonist)